jgi:hypothetical protein
MTGTIVVQAPAAATSTEVPSGGTPAATSTPVSGGATATPGTSGLPPTGQGSSSGGSDSLLLGALAIAAVSFASLGTALYRRTR